MNLDALRPFCSAQVWTMIQLQHLTGMRPCEVTRMRTGDIDRARAVWFYRPVVHKIRRQICLDARAQAVLRPWLRSERQEYLFQPAEVMAAWRAERTTRRKTPASCGNGVGSNRSKSPRKCPGQHYTTRSYWRAIQHACRKADLLPCRPSQLSIVLDEYAEFWDWTEEKWIPFAMLLG